MTRKLTLEQRIARLEKLLKLESGHIKQRKFEFNSRGLDNMRVGDTVMDVDGDEWKVVRIGTLDIMLRKGLFDNRREVSEYIDDNSLYDQNLMDRVVVLLRSGNDQVLCLEPENLEIIE